MITIYIDNKKRKKTNSRTILYPTQQCNCYVNYDRYNNYYALHVKQASGSSVDSELCLLVVDGSSVNFCVFTRGLFRK